MTPASPTPDPSERPSARAFHVAAVVLPLAALLVHHALGHAGDIAFFREWYLAVRVSPAFYRDGPGLNYPIVGVLFVTGPACVVDALLGRRLTLEEYQLVLKTTLALGEIALVLVSERLARALGEPRPRSLALMLYLLPSTWAGGAWFGQIDVFGTVLLALAALGAVRFHRDGDARALALALVGLVAAILTKQLTWFAAPALGLLILLGLRRHGTRSRWALALLSPSLLFAADPFLVLPDGYRSHVFYCLARGAVHADLAVASGASLWSLVAPGGTPAASIVWLGLDSFAWGWLAFALAHVAIAWAAWRRPDARALVVGAGLGELAMALLLTGVHERYLAHAIPLLLLGRGRVPREGVAFPLGVAVGVVSGIFVLASITPGAPAWASRPEPSALLSLAWGVALVHELRRRAR